MGGFGIIVILFEVLYACFTLYFFVNMVKQLKKKKLKYFKDLWDMLEFATLVMCVTVIVMYALKKVFGNVAMGALHEAGSGNALHFSFVFFHIVCNAIYKRKMPKRRYDSYIKMVKIPNMHQITIFNDSFSVIFSSFDLFNKITVKPLISTVIGKAK